MQYGDIAGAMKAGTLAAVLHMEGCEAIDTELSALETGRTNQASTSVSYACSFSRPSMDVVSQSAISS